jgi:3-oxoacyl-[acyl-carrier-protein] synthase II
VVAADEALRDSGIDPAREDLDRCGVITGSGIGGLTELESQHTVLMERGARRVSPFRPRLMINALSGNISIRNGFRGPNYITASACASSSHAIGLAFRSIRDGECDLCMTGGAEATITRLAMAGFSNMKANFLRNSSDRI